MKQTYTRSLTHTDVEDLYNYITTWNEAQVAIPNELRVKIMSLHSKPINPGIQKEEVQLEIIDNTINVEFTVDEIKILRECIKANSSLVHSGSMVSLPQLYNKL
jgi:hypothetical protein